MGVAFGLGGLEPTDFGSISLLPQGRCLGGLPSLTHTHMIWLWIKTRIPGPIWEVELHGEPGSRF